MGLHVQDMLGSQWSGETRCSLQELTLDLKSKSVKLSHSE